MQKRTPHHVLVSFTGQRLTHFGGVYLLQLFFKRLQLRKLLQRDVQFRQRNTRYNTAEEILALVYPIALSIGRIELTQLLKHNGVFHYLTGLARYPTPTTLRRFLFRMGSRALSRLRHLHDKLLAIMCMKPKLPSTMIFDLDSTVLLLYGKQEMAHVGYNPLKHGRPSYHPLLCFNALTKDFWHGELRAGDTHTATGTLLLLQAVFAKVPASVKRIIMRADKGFYDHRTIEYLESHHAFFAVVAKLTQPLKRKLAAVSYKTYASGIETGELSYQPTNWKKAYRFIVVRRPLPDDATEQLSLFSLGRYTYQVIVTNLTLTPLNAWTFYNKRAAIELIIKELKNNYPLAKIPTKYFAANETYFHILLFSYNLINWFKRLCLPKEYQTMTLNTLRSRLLVIPGELIRSGNRPTLKLPASFVYKNDFQYAAKKIEKFKI